MAAMKPHARIGLGIGLVILALAARLIPGPRTIDDSFITYRYARNLLAGEGFVYNPGERVQGTTTPVYTLLMAGLGALSGGTQAPFPWLALGVNALADATTALLLVRLGRHAGARWAGWAAGLVWAVAPYSVTFAIGGLETSLYVLLLTGAVCAYVEQRRVWTALLGALAILTRPDALILALPLGLDRLWRALRKGERLGWGEVLALALPGAAWGLFATFYFGSPIPHSVQAKLEVYRLGANEGLIRLLQHYATPFFENLWGGAWAIGVGLLLYPFLYLVGARRAARVQPRLLGWLVYPWLYLLVFAVSNPLIFRWYLTPPLPAYFLFLLLGAEELLSRLLRVDAAHARRAALAAACVCLLPLASTLGEWRLRPDGGALRPAPHMAFIELERLYQRAADALAPHMTPQTRLAAGDVGVLGFFTPAQILDTVGLNSPVSLGYYPLDPAAYVINYAVPADLLVEQQPDWVVVLEVYGRRTFLQDARFLSQYRLWKTLPTDMYGSQGMLIFQHAAP